MKTKITILVFFAICSLHLYSTNYTVTINTDDATANSGSLRDVITRANADASTPHSISFSGVTSITLTSVLPTISKPMIIDGGGTVTIVGFNSASNSMLCAATATLHLKDLTFNAAIVSCSGPTTADNCTFTGGTAGILRGSVALTCNGCTFYGNTNTGAGSAVNGNSSTNDVTLNNCIIRDNGLKTSSASGGAAICASGGNATTGSKLTINNCLIYNNVNYSTGTNYGGAIASGAAITITNSAIYNNSANRGAGITLYAGGASKKSSLTMTGCTVSGNSVASYAATAVGGGIYIMGVSTGTYTDNCTFTNCTISGNSTPVIVSPVTSSAGGGIQIGLGSNSVWGTPTFTFTNCTITGNTVQGNPTGNALAGGGIDMTRGNVVVNYCIVAGNNSNSSSASKDVFCSTLTSTTGRNLYGGTLGWNSSTTTGNVNLSADISTILNTSLADNGGTTALPDGTYVQTHALVAGCAAVNPDATGLDITALRTALSLPINDQRVFSRDATPDMGAYEYGAISDVHQVIDQKQLFIVKNGIESLVDGTIEVIMRIRSRDSIIHC
ncbi:MAG: choice-of-anchor Q domain-containing protein [Paludibacter sp.]